MQNHYFDNTHPLRPYTHSAHAVPGTIAPINALREPLPPKIDGKHPCEQNGKWGYVEDHKGKSGYVNGEPHEIKEYGPLPEGWSDTPPPPTTEELFSRLRSERDARISAVLWMRERHADELELGKETTLTPEQYMGLLEYIQELRDLPAQPGAPWDGGGELTPWPGLPEE